MARPQSFILAVLISLPMTSLAQSKSAPVPQCPNWTSSSEQAENIFESVLNYPSVFSRGVNQTKVPNPLSLELKKSGGSIHLFVNRFNATRPAMVCKAKNNQVLLRVFVNYLLVSETTYTVTRIDNNSLRIEGLGIGPNQIFVSQKPVKKSEPTNTWATR